MSRSSQRPITTNDALGTEGFSGKEGMLGLFRIDKRGERHVMVSYSEEAMKGILEDHFEVRG